jgi:hypothetical protein
MIYNLRQMYDFSLLQPRKLEIFFIKGRIKLLKQGIKLLKRGLNFARWQDVDCNLAGCSVQGGRMYSARWQDVKFNPCFSKL